MDAKHKAGLAALLGVIWIGLLVWQWGAAQEPVRVPLVNVSGVASGGNKARASIGTLRVNLELLAAATSQREATFTAPRNIFAVSGPEGVAPVTSGASLPVEEGMDQQVARQVSAVDAAQYKYLGFLRMTEGRDRNKNVAVLSKNEEVVVARVGDRFDDHFVVKAISPDSVIIRDLSAQLEHTVPLSDDSTPEP